MQPGARAEAREERKATRKQAAGQKGREEEARREKGLPSAIRRFSPPLLPCLTCPFLLFLRPGWTLWAGRLPCVPRAALAQRVGREGEGKRTRAPGGEKLHQRASRPTSSYTRTRVKALAAQRHWFSPACRCPRTCPACALSAGAALSPCDNGKAGGPVFPVRSWNGWRWCGEKTKHSCRASRFEFRQRQGIPYPPAAPRSRAGFMANG